MPRKRHKAEEIVAKLRGLRSEGNILDCRSDWLANFWRKHATEPSDIIEMILTQIKRSLHPIYI
jgi:hypothetical protein